MQRFSGPVSRTLVGAVAFTLLSLVVACGEKADPTTPGPSTTPPAPTCSDGQQNGTESDIDCGADCATLCSAGQGCGSHTDCETEFCNPNTDACSEPACTDGFQNGGETGTDCGALCPDNCPDGQGCLDTGDCVSAFCTPDTFLCATPGCDDGYLNLDETDTDCGGGCGADCLVDDNCAGSSANCASGFCRPTDNTCQAPTCTDGFLNRTETFIDCGGICGATCDEGETCAIDDDCVSDFCHPTNFACAPGVCADELLSLGETDVDCGGICGATCEPDEDCGANTDCLHNFCRPTDDTCQVPSCVDGFQNRTETDEDCGGICGPTCETDELCASDNGNCVDDFCRPTDNTCQVPICGDGFRNLDETDVDCGGTACGESCEIDEACDGVDGYCLSGFCRPTDDTCQEPNCDDDFQNQDETDEDCGGLCGATCLDGQVCGDAGDCVSGACDGTCYTACDASALGTISDGSANQQLVIAQIDPGSHIRLYNSTGGDIVLSGSTYNFCSPFTYAPLSSLASTVTVPAGGFANVPWPSNFADTDAGGEIILYSSSSFGTSSHIMDFVCWGQNPHSSRKSQADGAGKWSGACADALAGGVIHRLPNTTGTGVASYSTTCRP